MKKKITKHGQHPQGRCARKRPHSKDSEEEDKTEQCSLPKKGDIKLEKDPDQILNVQRTDEKLSIKKINEKLNAQKTDEHINAQKTDEILNDKKTEEKPNVQKTDQLINVQKTDTLAPAETEKDPEDKLGKHESNQLTQSLDDTCVNQDAVQSENGNLSDIQGVLNTPGRPHDQNNNSMASQKRDTTRDEPETKVDDEASRPNIETVEKTGENAKIGGDKRVGTGRESFIEHEDSTEPGDRIIAINLYGTDTDNVHPDPHVSETPTTTSKSEALVNRQQQTGNSYDQRCMEQTQTGLPQPTSQQGPVQTTPYPNHIGLSEYLDQRSTSEPCYNVQEESSTSISNHGTSPAGYARQEKITSFEGILSPAENYHEEPTPRSTMTLPLTHSRAEMDLTGGESKGHYHQTRDFPQTQDSSHRSVSDSIEDSNLAAEQLASELVQRYGNRNTHMIPGMLKQADGQQFGCDGFVQQSPELYTNHPQTLTKHEHIRGTPKQGHDVENMYYHQSMSGNRPVSFNSPPVFSTPDRMIHKVSTMNSSETRHGSYTYNDIQPHGVKWSTSMDRHPHGPPTDNEQSENPCPRHHLQPQRPQRGFNVLDGMESPTEIHRGAQYHRQVVKESSTPTLNTPVIDTHLRQDYQYQKHTPSMLGHQLPETDQYAMREYAESRHGEPGPCYNHYQPGTPLKKRHRMGKYSSPYLQPSPRPPAFTENMLPKLQPDFHPSHRAPIPQPDYFVANPSDTNRMSSRALLCRYIDFLILENEQITEISKSITPSCDVHVLENMTFMDSLKYNFPFPSKKFIKWVNFFFPKLNFWDIDFKGRKPMSYIENFMKMVDNRPTMELLRETFFFFQREACR